MNGEHQHPYGESSDKCPDVSVLLNSFSNDSLQSAQPPGNRLSDEFLEHHIESCTKCQAILQEVVIRERQTLAPLLDIQTGPENLAAGEPTAGLNREIPGFRIDRKLGHGGGAVVYLAEDLTTSRMVAIKFIENEPETNAEKRAQWLDEVRLAARIEHQNVVRLYHVEESPDYFLLVFEYVAGGTLNDWKDLPATTLQIAQLISTIALAVHQIHQLGILHLDLKPSNILIDTSAGESWDTIQPKVSDFGISSWHRPNEIDATKRSFGRGTPSYMAPEQVFGDPALLSPATDVYGLGGLLFTLLTGSPPFVGSSSTQIVRQVIESPATVLEEQTRPLPDGLREITLRCLQKHPEYRYSTTKELADELNEWIKQQQPRPGTQSTVRRFTLTAVSSIAVMCLIAFVRGAGPNWFSDLQPTPTQNTPTVKSPTVQSTETVMSVTEWVDLISRDPAAFDSDSAAGLVTATRFHTNDVLSRSPVSFELCLRYGMLQERAVERFVASLNKQHFALGAELLAESIRLLAGQRQVRNEACA